MIDSEIHGEIGQIMFDYQWNEMVRGYGLAQFTAPVYDKKLWPDNGYFEAPTLRGITSIVCDIAGSVTGQSWWLGLVDDAVFAALDLGIENKDPTQVALGFAKAAAINTMSFGVGAAGKAVTAAASTIANTALRVGAQAAWSMGSSYISSVGAGFINALNYSNGSWSYDIDSAVQNLYSVSTISGAVGGGVTSGLNVLASNYLVDSTNLALDGRTFYTEGIYKATGLAGGLAANLTSLAMGGDFLFLQVQQLELLEVQEIQMDLIYITSIDHIIKQGGNNMKKRTIILFFSLFVFCNSLFAENPSILSKYWNVAVSFKFNYCEIGHFVLRYNNEFEIYNDTSGSVLKMTDLFETKEELIVGFIDTWIGAEEINALDSILISKYLVRINKNLNFNETIEFNNVEPVLIVEDIPGSVKNYHTKWKFTVNSETDIFVLPEYNSKKVCKVNYNEAISFLDVVSDSNSLETIWVKIKTENNEGFIPLEKLNDNWKIKVNKLTKNEYIKTIDYIHPESVKVFNKDILSDVTSKANLRLRSSPDLNGEIITTMKKGTVAKLIEIGKTDYIDGIFNNWVLVEVENPDQESDSVSINKKGWCFAGYLE